MLDDPYAQVDEPPRRAQGWIVPALATLAVLGWTGFFTWANQATILASPSPAQWTSLVAGWVGPVLLIAVAWLLAMRNSRSEALRFGDAAKLLRDESLALESRMITVNQELSLAREFIAAQSRDLESLGRIAAERLSQHADRLQGLVRDNGAQVEAIASVSSSALDNMDRLRGQLPVIASSAKDVTNNIANAGRVAHAHLEDMVSGFRRLNEFGQASERQVISLRGQVSTALEEFGHQAEQLEHIAGARFAALAEQGAQFRTQLDSHEVEALASIQTRARTLAEELEANRQQLDGHEAESLTSLRARMILLRDEASAIARSLRDNETGAQTAWGEALGRFEADARQALSTVDQIDREAIASAKVRLDKLVEEAARHEDSLRARNQQFAQSISEREAAASAEHEAALHGLAAQLATLDAQLAQRRAAHEAQSARLIEQGLSIAGQLQAFDGKLGEIEDHGASAQAALSASLQTLARELQAGREALAGTDRAVAGLTESSVRLLELIKASAQHTREDIPQAMGASEQRLDTLEARIFTLRDVVAEADRHGQSLSDYVIATNQHLGDGLGQLDRLHQGLAERANSHGDALAGLAQSLEALSSDTDLLATKAQGELREAIALLTQTAHEAVTGIEASSAAAVSAVATKLGEESGAALDKVLRVRSAEAAGQLEQAAAHAAGVSREAAIQLRDQLSKVDELAGNLERRVAQAREKAEEHVDNDFSRRVALITEALNSHAIDITKALSTDVTDTAWAAYLRGDRGIFTRRAVRLLDGTEARTVADIYENEREFRDHVSHYIHDFEAMLRQLLSTRDGHALGVTLLSSDMGKLYVALAQAIKRLRN